MLPALVLSFAIISQAPTVTDQPQAEAPSASGGHRVARIAVEVGSSLVGGLLVGTAAGIGTCILESAVSSDAWCIAPIFLFAPLGYLLGSVTGTYVGGRLIGGDGGYGWALLGAALGGLSSIAALVAIAGRGSSAEFTVVLTALGFLPIFGSIIGYELSCSSVEPTFSFAPGPNPKAQFGVRWRF